jgi:hypothetical protein
LWCSWGNSTFKMEVMDISLQYVELCSVFMKNHTGHIIYPKPIPFSLSTLGCSAASVKILAVHDTSPISLPFHNPICPLGQGSKPKEKFCQLKTCRNVPVSHQTCSFSLHHQITSQNLNPPLLSSYTTLCGKAFVKVRGTSINSD